MTTALPPPFHGDRKADLSASDFIKRINLYSRDAGPDPAAIEACRKAVFPDLLSAGGPAEEWWEALPQKTQAGTWDDIVTAFKARFPEPPRPVRTSDDYVDEMLVIGLKLEDFNTIGDDKVLESIKWAQKVEHIARNGGIYSSSHGIRRVFDSLPIEIRELGRVPHNAPDWATFLRGVTEMDRGMIAAKVLRVSEAKKAEDEMRRMMASFQSMAVSAPRQPVAMPPPMGPVMRGYPPRGAPPIRAPMPRLPFPRPPVNKQALRAVVDTQVIHPNTPAGVAAYTAEVSAWNAAHGADTMPSAALPPFPLSPGSVKANSRECWKCGVVTNNPLHNKTSCTGTPLPEKEQRWRTLVSSELREWRSAAQMNYVGAAQREAYAYEGFDGYGSYPVHSNYGGWYGYDSGNGDGLDA